MTIEHCVLSAAFDREPTTCRDLCVQKHTNVELTDPTGYTFPVATDSACRNRLLHSRPIDGVGVPAAPLAVGNSRLSHGLQRRGRRRRARSSRAYRARARRARRRRRVPTSTPFGERSGRSTRAAISPARSNAPIAR